MKNKEKIKLNVKEIQERQKELAKLGILGEFKDYKITEEYLNEFLEKYSELSGVYGYKQAAIVFPLFKRIKKINPNISEEELINEVQKLFPIIIAMLHSGGIFKLIKDVSKMSDEKIEKELDGDGHGK